MHMPLEDTLGLNLLAANQHQAEHNREHFDAWRLLCLNLMSSPGAGKTSLLERSLAQLSNEFAMAVLEGDMTSSMPNAWRPSGYRWCRSPRAGPVTWMRRW